MSSIRKNKQAYGSPHRQKFIIPPLQKNAFNSAHYNFQTASLNSASLKRNLLFTSTKQRSLSQKKIASDQNFIRRTDDVKSSKLKKVMRGTSAYEKEEQNQHNIKFKVINTELDPGVSWQKWKKRNINVAGKNFIMALNERIQTQAIGSEIEEKQNIEVFKLRHKICELNTLKQTIRITKDNNDLIKKLQKESNDKIRVFFGRYEKMVQEVN